MPASSFQSVVQSNQPPFVAEQVMGQDAEQAVGGGEFDILLPGRGVGCPPACAHPPAIRDGPDRMPHASPEERLRRAIRGQASSAPDRRRAIGGSSLPGLEGRPPFEQQIVGVGQAGQAEGVRAETRSQPVQQVDRPGWASSCRSNKVSCGVGASVIPARVSAISAAPCPSQVTVSRGSPTPGVSARPQMWVGGRNG